MNLDLFLFVASAVCFLLAAIGIPKANWIALGLLFFVLTFII